MAESSDGPAALALEDFAPHVGTTFSIAEIGEDLVLESAEARRTSAEAPRAAFSLTFRGAGEAALPQQIHSLEHAALGRLAIFLVPIERGPDGMRYEAVFA